MAHPRDDMSLKAIGELEAGRSALVWRRQIADTDTPISAALKLMESDRGDFLLESVEGGSVRGRYSLLGLAPDLMFRVHGDRAEINRHWRTDTAAFVPMDGGALDALRALVAECQAEIDPALPAALACLVGYFSYETIGLVEKIARPPENPMAVPDMLFARPTVILIFDRLADALYLVSPVWKGSFTDAASAVDDALDRIDAVAARLAGPLPAHMPAPELPDAERNAVMAPEKFADMVHRAKDYIVAGDIFQVVLAQRFTTPFALPPISLYRALRRVNPSPFLFLLDMPGFALVGSSPEILVRLRDGEVTIRPIAGTRPRGRTACEDAANRESLLADEKERAEHLMLLDLGRNDVGRVAQAGTVTVTDSFDIEFYSHVMHIVSNVTGRIAPGKDALDALFAGFPAGTVSGAPKVRACQIIAELEPETRGPYAGCVGYFSPDGNMDSCIVLRTGLLKDGTLHIQAGAGIVADSRADYEQRECEAKSGALFAAAQEAVAVARQSGFGQ